MMIKVQLEIEKNNNSKEISIEKNNNSKEI